MIDLHTYSLINVIQWDTYFDLEEYEKVSRTLRAGHYTVARRIRRINPSHSFPSVIVAIVSHGHGF